VGTVPYATAYEWQRVAAQRRIGGDPADAIIVVEHTPVVTMGRVGNPKHILASRTTLADRGIDFVETDRGGDVTYHGPGQLVAYPIMNLARYRKDIGWYLRRLEETVIGVLDDFGIAAGRIDNLTGVWAGGSKVAAIGVAIRRWVTYHGVALNVSTNMDHFKLITPCGIPDRPVVSMRDILGRDVTVDEVTPRFVTRFADVFEIDTVRQGCNAELASSK
jgi:lipoate-protein ligase B